MIRWAALCDIILILSLTMAAAFIAMVAGVLATDTLVLPVVLAIQGTLILLGVYVLVRTRGLSWRALRFRPPRVVDLFRGCLALLLFFAVNIAVVGVVYLLRPEWLEVHRETLGALSAELAGQLTFPVVALMMLFVAFYEEVVARGALLARSQALLGGVWLPVILSSLLFGAGHFYQGWLGVVQTTVAGLVLARLTLYWGTLWPAIFAHAGLNTLSLMAIEYGLAT